MIVDNWSNDRPMSLADLLSSAVWRKPLRQKRSHMRIIIQMNTKYIITTLDLHISRM